MTFKIDDEVRSRRDAKIAGTVIGYGTLQWDSDVEEGAQSVPNHFTPVLVYLVKTRPEGSSALGPAVAVLRCDQTVGRFS